MYARLQFKRRLLRSQKKWPVNKPIPHFMDVKGTLVDTMARVNPVMKVQIEVDVDAYVKRGIHCKGF